MWIAVTLLVLLMVTQRRTGNLSDSIKVRSFAEAIARAEGWYVQNSLPRRRNNPGSITDSSGKLIQYSSESAGWEALYSQIRRMVSGSSRYYSPDMTLLQAAVVYTGNDKPDAWARIVSGQLGVSTSARLGDLA